MYWRMALENREGESPPSEGRVDGRFVLHRHQDEGGPHLDLRLEENDCLVGWRIDSESLQGEPWATAKGPHTLDWLERSGEVACEDKGVYVWTERCRDGGVLTLYGREGARVLTVTRQPGLPVSCVRSIAAAVESPSVRMKDVPGLIRDGVTARSRAVARLCGLARELDGSAFNEEVCRKMLGTLSLDEIHIHLRAYESRFDRKYPPGAVSQPEALDEGEDGAGGRRDQALWIVRG